jgi:hypothetical protein
VATTLTALAAVLGGIALIITAYTGLIVARRVKAIDHAVNGKPVGAQTMQSQVGEIHRRGDTDAVLPLLRQILSNQERQ